MNIEYLNSRITYLQKTLNITICRTHVTSDRQFKDRSHYKNLKNWNEKGTRVFKIGYAGNGCYLFGLFREGYKSNNNNRRIDHV